MSSVLYLLFVLFIAGGLVSMMVMVVVVSLGMHSSIKLTMRLFCMVTLWASVVILAWAYIVNLLS